MTPKQVLEDILLSMAVISRFHFDAYQRHGAAVLDTPDGSQANNNAIMSMSEHYGRHATTEEFIELVRSTGAQILHASDLTQQDEKTPA